MNGVSTIRAFRSFTTERFCSRCECQYFDTNETGWWAIFVPKILLSRRYYEREHNPWKCEAAQKNEGNPGSVYYKSHTILM